MQNMSSTKFALMERKDGRYSFSCNGDAQLLTIALFLADDCPGFLIDRRIKWTLDPNEDEIDFNATSLCKVGAHIELSSLIDERSQACVFFSIKDFIDMLEAWQEIINSFPPAVRIKLTEGKIILEALSSATKHST